MSRNRSYKCVTLKGFDYSINEEEKTASVDGCESSAAEIIIPYSIKHESKEYIVTSISNRAFERSKIRSVKFEANSELRTIEKYAFFQSDLESILIPKHVTQICEYTFSCCKQLDQIEFEPNSELRTIEKYAFTRSNLVNLQIPASTVDLKDGWCSEAYYLSHVEVDSGNARYLSVKGEYIIGKSDITQEDYDTLVFWTRNSTEASIPGTIKIIGAYAFSYSKLAKILIPSHITQICECAFFYCEQLTQIEFEANSKLRIIENNVFFDSKISKIVIPAYVTQICERAFYYCKQLALVEFEANSELKIIEKEAFSYSKLASIKIPARTVELKDGWCKEAYDMSHVEVESGNARYLSVDNKFIIGKSRISQEDYDTLVFWARDSIEANIPGTIKIIGAYAFSESDLERIMIPSHVTHICEEAFSWCRQLSQVEFEANSELRIIEKLSFCCSKLSSVLIPAHVTKICESAFYYCEHLTRVEFETNSELQIIGKEAFSYSKLMSILIPAHVTQICERAFSWCKQLSRVEFEANSELRTIENEAFSYSKLMSILIPTHVTQICERAFSWCKQLSRVEFEANSELRTIEKYAFSLSNLASILISAHVTHIHESAFSNCKQLRIVEIDQNSVEESINLKTYIDSEIIMLPEKKKIH